MSRAFDRALMQAALLARLADANLIVNGFMAVSQENGTTAVTTGKWPVDQFLFSSAITSMTAQQVTAPFPSQPDIEFGLKVTAPNAGSLAASDTIYIQQPIEAINLKRLNYGNANARWTTVAFMLRPSFTGVAGFSIGYNPANGSAVRAIQKRLPLVANQDNFFCLQIPGDLAQSLPSGNVAGLYLRWCFGCGTTGQSANLDTWNTNNQLASADVTNMAAVAGQSIILGACVMVPGRVNISQDQLPLLARKYDDEDRACRRYYESGYYDVLGYNVSQQYQGAIHPIIKKRISPSLSWNNTYSANLYSLTARMIGDHVQFYGSPNGTNAFEVSGNYAANARM